MGLGSLFGGKSDQPKLQKLKIQPFDAKRKPKKGFEVQYNPESFSIKLESPYQKKKMAGSEEFSQFTAVKRKKLSFSLHYSTYGDGNKSVRVEIKKLTDLAQIDRTIHKPPLCLVAWGKLKMLCFLETYSIDYTMFTNDGLPVRAKVDVTFIEADKADITKKRNSLESADRSKERQLQGGDQLWHIADNEYDDPTHWKTIAHANNIDNPRLVKVGAVLKVPSLED